MSDRREVQHDSSGFVVDKTGTKHITSSSTYNTTSGSRLFGSILTETDNSGNITRYYYDSTDGRLLAALNQTHGTGTAYTYDTKGNLVSVRLATYASSVAYNTVTNAESVSYAYNSENLLSSITTASTTYTLTYDAFGNSDVIKAGSLTLADYTYNQNNGKLSSVTYGNGAVVSYVYDELENLKEICYNGVKKYEYLYTSDGQVAELKDYSSGIGSVYKYDTSGRLVAIAEYSLSDNFADIETTYMYNQRDMLSGKAYRLSYTVSGAVKTHSASTGYTYNTDGSLSSQYLSLTGVNGNVYYTYDTYDRLTKKRYSYTQSSPSSASFSNTVNYEYANGASSTTTTSRVSKYTSTVGSSSEVYTYTYDSRGNITEIVCTSPNGNYTIRYHYDDIGQLVREDNSKRYQTYVYEYDNAGNITARKSYAYTTAATVSGSPSTTSFRYTSSSWGDLMTSYNGTGITYDSMGNPLSYYNGMSYTFGWTGRLLTSATYGGKTMSFTYNADGIRTSKTVNGVTTRYFLDGSTIIGEETNGNIYMYIYDAEGSPIGMRYRASTYAEGIWDTYYFEKNLQGDIVALYSADGTLLVTYSYTAWGQTFYISNGAPTQAVNNPFRYRGYYFDKDLSIYYLNSRYYDQYVGRFISPDEMMSGTNGSLHGFNLYAYAFNNPVMFTDGSGNWPDWKKIWKGVCNFFKDTFGAGATTTNTVKYEESYTHPSGLFTAASGTEVVVQEKSYGDSSKPVSVYANAEKSNLIESSSAGVKLNFGNSSVNVSVALDNIGISLSHRDKNGIEESVSLYANLSQFKLEGKHSIKNGDSTVYTKAGVSGWIIIATVYFLSTGDASLYHANPQTALINLK